MQSIPNRNTMYVVEGGVLYIYDTTTGTIATHADLVSWARCTESYRLTRRDGSSIGNEAGGHDGRPFCLSLHRRLLRLKLQVVLRRLIHGLGENGSLNVRPW